MYICMSPFMPIIWKLWYRTWPFHKYNCNVPLQQEMLRDWLFVDYMLHFDSISFSCYILIQSASIVVLQQSCVSGCNTIFILGNNLNFVCNHAVHVLFLFRKYQLSTGKRKWKLNLTKTSKRQNKKVFRIKIVFFINLVLYVKKNSVILLPSFALVLRNNIKPKRDVIMILLSELEFENFAISKISKNWEQFFPKS